MNQEGRRQADIMWQQRMLADFNSMQPPQGHQLRQQYDWRNQNLLRFPVNSGPKHFYPVQQMFMQHGPFGNSPAPFHQARFPLFPPPMGFHRLPLPRFNNHNLERRRNGNSCHDAARQAMPSGRRHYQDNERVLLGSGHNGFGSGVKSKTGKSHNHKERHKHRLRKKSYRQNSNTESVVSLASGEDTQLKSHEQVNSSCDRLEVPNSMRCAGSRSVPDSLSQCNNNVSDSDDKGDNLRACSPSGASLSDIKILSDSEEQCGAEGGGVECDNVSNRLPSPDFEHVHGEDVSQGENNLIDEGAICDLDNMFQHQEASRLNGEVEGFYEMSDEDEECEEFCFTGSIMADGTTTVNYSDHLTEDDSNSEWNFGAVGPSNTVRESAAKFSPSKSSVDRNVDELRYIGGNGGLEDNEDTGDFIDTDLPAQCLMSSSDDNDSSSDRDEITTGLDNVKQVVSDINCNNLPCDNHATLLDSIDSLRIASETDSATLSASCKPSSQGAKPKNLSTTSVQSRKQSSPKSFVCYQSTDSDSDGCKNRTTPRQANRPKRHRVRGRTSNNFPINNEGCADGAAASQVLPKAQQKTNTYLSQTSPPGAESEFDFHLLPKQSSSCHNAHGAGAIAIPFELPGNTSSLRSSLSAVHASCEPCQAQACESQHSRQKLLLSKTITDGGACSASEPLVQCPGLQSLAGNEHSSACCPEDQHSNLVVPGRVSKVDTFDTSSHTHGPNDGSGSEDPSLSHDIGDNVDMVLLPMEEEIEPVLRMGGLLYTGVGGAGSAGDIDSASSSGLSANGPYYGSVCEDHETRCLLDSGHLRGAVPSKEFYELIKTVSTTDSYMRFYDKDGHDVQRERVEGSDDEHGTDDTNRVDRLRVDRVMIWNEYEAYVMQFKQIAVSACGQTAVLNVLKALKIPCEKSAVCKVIQGSLRKEEAGIPEYLFSRAVAGTRAEELMSGIETLSGGSVGGRFFPFWPPRKIKLLQWLAYWMKRGAIPVATLNLQQGPQCPSWEVPDSWHHQMVYGVSHQGLYLTNPLEIVSERSAMQQLCSDSVLMIRRQDIISRYRKMTDLGELLTHSDPRWCTMNVLGQVVNVLREFNMPSVPGYRVQVTSHISIPACYKAGITLFMRKEKPAWSTLLNAPDLPLEVPSRDTVETRSSHHLPEAVSEARAL